MSLCDILFHFSISESTLVMAENKKKDENLLMNLAQLRKRALDVKFDLDLNEYQPIENIGIGADHLQTTK